MNDGRGLYLDLYWLHTNPPIANSSVPKSARVCGWEFASQWVQDTAGKGGALTLIRAAIMFHITG